MMWSSSFSGHGNNAYGNEFEDHHFFWFGGLVAGCCLLWLNFTFWVVSKEFLLILYFSSIRRQHLFEYGINVNL